MNDRVRLILALATAASVACSSEPKPEPETANAAIDMAPPAPATSSAAADMTPSPPPQPEIEIVEGTPATPPEKVPSLAIKAPTANQVIPADKAGDYEVKLDLKGWEVPEGGNHVHVIIDGRPYKRIDDAKAPIKLKDIDPSYTLTEGQHVLVAFPSRPTHESVKPAGKASPVAVQTFWIGKKGTPGWKPTDPTFVYSRPKGANDGPLPPEGLLLDFYLLNAELGDGQHRLEATLTGPGVENGKTVMIKDWKPWRIKNARDGKYNLKMKLLDKEGKTVPGSWNDVSHDFSVNTKAQAAGGHAGH